MEITWSADGPRGQGDGRGRITRKYVDFNELSDIVDAESMIRRVIGRWTRLDVSCHIGGAGTATRPDGHGLPPPPRESLEIDSDPIVVESAKRAKTRHSFIRLKIPSGRARINSIANRHILPT